MSKDSKEYLKNMHMEAFNNKIWTEEAQIKDALDRYYLNEYRSRINILFDDNETRLIKNQVEYCARRGRTTFTFFVCLLYNSCIYVKTDSINWWSLVNLREYVCDMPSPLKNIIREKKLDKLNVISKENIKDCISYFKFQLKNYGFDIVDTKYHEYLHIIDKEYDKIVARRKIFSDFFDKEIVIPIEVSF